MAFTVVANNGDTLCSIARRNGFSDCRPLRALPANNPFLGVILQQGNLITIPENMDEGGIDAVIATGKRHLFQVWSPQIAAAPVQLRFVRTPVIAPSNADAIVNIGISRYAPPYVSADNSIPFPDHNQRGFNQHAFNDPNAFNVEVIDPNTNNQNVVIYLQALKPIYHAGLLQGHQKFPAGPVRDARTLQVTCSRMPADNTRRRSCYLRLVVDPDDKAMLPGQTLLVTDMVNGNDPWVGNADPEVEILDQDILATYEYADCPLPARQKCILAQNQIPLRRGRSVEIEAFILRRKPDGTNNDNGLVQRQNVQQRIGQNCRRIWAQEELTFVIQQILTVDPPSDMLTVAEPDGSNASGHQPNSNRQGYVDFTIHINRFDGQIQFTQQSVDIVAANTPVQTATAIRNVINQAGIPELTARISPNAPEGANPQGSVDIILRCTTGQATITQISSDDEQDSAQKVQAVRFDIDNVSTHQPPSNFRKGGGSTRRQLFKSYQTDPQRISIFVVEQGRGGLTTTALDYLPLYPVDAEVRNCITMKASFIDGNLTYHPAILPHEIGHALTDADHADHDVSTTGSLMQVNTGTYGGYDDTKRVSGPGQDHPFQIVSDQGPPWYQGQNPVGPLGVIEVQQTTMHARIIANNSLIFTPR